MDLAATAIPRNFAFNTLLQNGVERQAGYERGRAAHRIPSRRSHLALLTTGHFGGGEAGAQRRAGEFSSPLAWPRLAFGGIPRYKVDRPSPIWRAALVGDTGCGSERTCRVAALTGLALLTTTVNLAIGAALQRLMKREPVSLVHIGAHVGNNGNDPLFETYRDYHRNQATLHRLTAILVEPVPRYFRQLLMNCLPFDFVICENVAIGRELALNAFYVLSANAEAHRGDMPEWTSQLGSLLKHRISDLFDSYEMPKLQERGADIRKFLNDNTIQELVITITLDQLLQRNHWDSFDALQIDAEGYDFEILKTIEFSRHQPKLINYERVLLGKSESVARDLLTSQGYALYDSYADTLAVRGDYLHIVAD